MTKIIVAGGREFTDVDLMKLELNRLWKEIGAFTIVSGGAKGADQLGESVALSASVPVVRYPADWDKYGKSAGYKRNEAMARVADGLIAFWDGESKGTGHMIDIATREGLFPIIVIRYSKES